MFSINKKNINSELYTFSTTVTLVTDFAKHLINLLDSSTY